jgi:hypothetical protein
VVVSLDQFENNRLADLDVDISDAVLFKNLPTHAGHNNAISTGERRGNHPFPEDDRGMVLSIIADAHNNNVDAGLLDFHRFQEGVDLESQVALPDLVDCMVSGLSTLRRWVDNLKCEIEYKGEKR